MSVSEADGQFICMTMAAFSGSPLLKISDYVFTEGRTCFVQQIENKLGFNTYVCVDLDSGVVLRKPRYQLEKCDAQFLNLPDDFVFDPAAVKVEKKEDLAQKRFQDMTEQELDDLAVNRNSYRTRKQTEWAVRIFKGETLDL